MLRITNKRLIPVFLKNFACFSEQTSSSVTKKGYRMPERHLQKKYTPKRPLFFHQGRALLYLNKQGILTPTLIQTHLYILMIYFGYLIKNNPFYLTFPAALPLMGFAQIFLLIRLVTHKKDNKYQIQRVYLTETGQMVQIWLANKVRRKLKDTFGTLYIPVKNLKTPPTGDNQLPLKGSLFPQNFNIQLPAPWQYGWNKYDITRENYIFPKKYQYANWQALVPVMKGIIIDTSNCPKTPIPIEQQKTLPTLEQGIQQVYKLKKYEQEWEKQNGPLKFNNQDIQ